MNFVIKNISILQPDKILTDASILVENGIIKTISQESLSHINTIDGNNNLLIPGIVNSHTHASMSLFRGLGEGYKDRLTKFMFPLEKKAVSAELVFLAGLYGFAEMITHGVTAFCDMYYYEEMVGKAAETLGIRGVIGQTIVNFVAPDTKIGYEGLDLAHKIAESWKDNPLISFAYAPHAPYTVEPNILREINKFAKIHNALVTMHVAEFEDEWTRIKAISDIKENETVIEYLKRHEALHPSSIYAHLIHLNSNDIEILADYGIHAAHCPVANAKSGKGIAPVLEMKNKGITIGLGTDGPMSGNRLSMRDVLSYTYSMAKLRSGDPTHLSPKDVFYFATKGGYETIHISNGGELTEGSLADFSLIDINDIGMVPDYDAIANLILSVSDRAFLATWVNGKKVADNGIPVGCDWELYKKEIFSLKNRLRDFVHTL